MPFHLSISGPEKIGCGSSTSNSGGTKLANPTLVSYTDKITDSATNPPAQAQEQCVSTIQTRKRTSTRDKVETDGMSLIRQYLSNKGISQEAQTTSLNSCGQTHKNNIGSSLTSGSHMQINGMQIPFIQL